MKTFTYDGQGNLLNTIDDGVEMPLADNSIITSSRTLPAGKFTFMVDATNGAVNLTPELQGGDYKIVKIDSTSNPVTFKATVNGIQDMSLINQYANMNLFGSGTTYFLGGNN